MHMLLSIIIVLIFEVSSTTIKILDSPATTSATTYKVQTACTSGVVTINQFFNTSNYFGISTITAMEVSG